MYRLIERNPAYLRFFHWSLTLLLLVIIPTGFYIHQPFPFMRINYHIMFSIHVFCGFALSYLLMSRAYYAIWQQNYQSIVFTWQDLKELPALFSYYLFFRAEKPPERKYNAGQRLMYTLWFISLSLANISGALAYKESYFLPIAKIVGGLHHLAWVTLFTALLLSFTIPLHIYLSITENSGHLQSLLSGYSYVLEPNGAQPQATEITTTRLPGRWLWDKLLSFFR